jgi:hypothetical protein
LDFDFPSLSAQVINKRSSTGVTLFSYTDELCCHFFASTCAHTIERYHVERDVRSFAF